jgi:homoserine O-succinyltransferase/O-acetyltransferase
MQTLKIGILDMYTGTPNEGMRCIKSSIELFGLKNNVNCIYETFDIRGAGLVPNIYDFDAFISTGGPGSPILEGVPWESIFFEFLDTLFDYNKNAETPKSLLAICHSFQLMYQYFDLGIISKRKSTSFGIMPIHHLASAQNEPLFKGLSDPFWVVDSRDYQAISPKIDIFDAKGIKILCLEKERPHVKLERAIMAIRFDAYTLGTQFHPEADGEGMHRLFQTPEKRDIVIKNYGLEKYQQMIAGLADPEKIEKTENCILPNFFAFSLNLKYKNALV